MNQSASNALGLLVLLSFGGLGGFYGILLYPEEFPLWVHKLLGELSAPLSLAAPLLYLLFWIQHWQDPRKKKDRQKSSWTLLGLLAFVSGMGILYPFVGRLWAVSLGGSLVLIGGYVFPRGLEFGKTWGIKNPPKKEESDLGFVLKLADGWINLVNPFRGALVIGAAGSGKSYSIAEPILEQAISKGYSGIVYDFKFPTLSNLVYSTYLKQRKEVDIWVVNFKDLSRSHRLNPIKPQNLPMVAYAEEYAQAVISNLRPDTIAKKDYWISSATKIFSATIWYMKKHHPKLCTLPHIVALICNKRFQNLLYLLESDIETAPLIADMSVAVELGAEKQVAGVVGTLQNALSSLNTPEIFWVLTGDDFELDLNNPDRKSFLCLGTDPTLSETFAPVVACIITVALKLMNQQGKAHSLVLLDEAPTIFIPKFDTIPATARSNKIATLYMAQDLSQMVQSYGEVNSEVILGNLNNQFFGKVANKRTADYVAQTVGKEEKEILSYGENISGKGIGMLAPESMGRNQSYSFQERDLVRPQEVMNQRVGEFTGLTVGKKGNQWFKGQIKRNPPREIRPIPAFCKGIDASRNFERIHQEAQNLLESVNRDEL